MHINHFCATGLFLAKHSFSIIVINHGGTLNYHIEQLSIECKSNQDQKTFTITLANHKGHRHPVNQSELEANTCNGGEAQENICKQVMIGFSFTSDWLTKQCKFYR